MKTTKIILSIALVTLATSSFGQLSLKERFFPNRNQEVAYFVTANYKSEHSRIESWMHDLRSWASERNTRNTYEAPVVLEAITIDQAEVVYEEEMGLESWMSAPFEAGVSEEELYLESWMSAPFESGLAEDELYLESWMSTPFESSVAEEVISIESWMSSPFDSSAEIEMEDWMTSIWI